MGRRFFLARSFSASDLVRFDESLDVARNKPDEFAEPHEWDRRAFMRLSKVRRDMLSRSAVCILSSRLLLELCCIVMPCVACQPADFTFYLFMAGHPLLSVGHIFKETGLTRQRIWQLAVTRRIPAKRANPNGKQHRFYDSAEFAAWRKEKARQSARPRASQVRRAYRISRRRREKIEKLREILENQTEVSASDKKAALLYYRCLFELWWGVKLFERRIPLLEGIHALYESKLIFHDWKIDFIDLESAIEGLPTYSETTPQTEQSSLNVSARSQTKRPRRARRQARGSC